VAGDHADIRDVLERSPKSASLIINPNGEVIAEVPPGEEGFAVAEIDLGESIEYKQIHDVVGYYNRFDVFDFRLNRKRHRPITIHEGTDAAADPRRAMGPLSADELFEDGFVPDGPLPASESQSAPPATPRGPGP
jgi:aliphatic nitrilase